VLDHLLRVRSVPRKVNQVLSTWRLMWQHLRLLLRSILVSPLVQLVLGSMLKNHQGRSWPQKGLEMSHNYHFHLIIEDQNCGMYMCSPYGTFQCVLAKQYGIFVYIDTKLLACLSVCWSQTCGMLGVCWTQCILPMCWTECMLSMCWTLLHLWYLCVELKVCCLCFMQDLCHPYQYDHIIQIN
jgi:hypothetical protein